MGHPSFFGGNLWFDLAGRSFHGTLTNGASPSGSLGRIGGNGCISFDGTNDYVSVPSSAPLQVATGNFTVCCWFLAASFGGFRCLFDKGDSSANRELAFFIDTTSGGGFNVGHSGFNGLTYSPAWTTGEWQQFCWTRSGTSNTFYRNAVSCATATDGSSSTNSLALAIGGNLSGGGSYWNGSIDDFRIYGRALSAAEVYAVYADGLLGYPQSLRRVPRTAWFAKTSAAPAANTTFQAAFGAGWGWG